MRSNIPALLLLLGISVANANTNQPRDDAWWTGPLLAASPGSLTPGHFLIEPYLFDAIPQGHYDNDGQRHPAPHANDFGSQSYLLYGLTDRVGVGLIPRFGFNDVSDGRDSSKIGVGDLTVQAQYGLTRFEAGSWVPPTAGGGPGGFSPRTRDPNGDRP